MLLFQRKMSLDNELGMDERKSHGKYSEPGDSCLGTRSACALDGHTTIGKSSDVSAWPYQANNNIPSNRTLVTDPH